MRLDGRMKKASARLIVASALALSSASLCCFWDGKESSRVKLVIKNPNQTTSQIIGVQTHTGGRTLEKGFSIAKTVQATSWLGVSSVRDSVAWSSFVGTPLTDQPRRNGPLLRLLPTLRGPIILTLSKGDYRLLDGGLPDSSDSRTEFTRFAAQAYRLFESQRPIIEVWNEWNWGGGTQPRIRGSAAAYLSLAKAVAATLRQQRNRPLILVGSAGEDSADWSWTIKVIRAGALNYGDGLAVHLYNQCLSPQYRTAEQMVQRLADLHLKMEALGVRSDYPVYITEAGWPTNSGTCGLGMEQVADNIAKLIVELRLMPWIRGVWLYDLRNDGLDPSDPEQNFGLLDYGYKPKVAACALRKIISLTKPAKIKQVLRSAEQTVFTFTQSDGQDFQIGWTPTSHVWYKLSGGKVSSLCS